MLSPIFVAITILLVHCGSSLDLMSTDITPNPGDDSPGTVYKAGLPGANWSPEEIESTRQRIIGAITPLWPEKQTLGTGNGLGTNKDIGETTENVLMRLIFHDCIPYLNGSQEDRACDGCLNFEGMFDEAPSANKAEHVYKFDPPKNTNNHGLGGAAMSLEKIYKSIDWPYTTPINPDLTTSLHQSGKSRADLWQFAGMVALERTIERANRACDLDFHVRQQTTILESRDACEIKLTKPLKFVTGRIDCNNENENLEDCVPKEYLEEYGISDAGFITCKAEDQPELMGDGKHLIQYGEEKMNVETKNWIALQGIHGAVHAARIGIKYTWFGSGYLSNMYFKMIANHPMYKMHNVGGDLSFTSCTSCDENEKGCGDNLPGKKGNSLTVKNVAVGDTNGNPIPMTGWRASCSYVWNTPEGGPCILRPVPPGCPGNPVWDDPETNGYLVNGCSADTDKITGEPIHSKNGGCKDIIINSTTTKTGYQFNLLVKGKADSSSDLNPGHAYWDDPNDDNWKDLSKKTQSRIKACAWSNQFAFPWEIGMYWDFKVGGDGKRAMGCPGLDDYEYGVVNPESEWNPHWPFIKPQSRGGPRHSFQASPRMRCGHSDATSPDGTSVVDIIDQMASDNNVFAENFLEGWHQMTTNGYADTDLVDGPDNGWLGHYSLTEQGITEHLEMKFSDYIAKKAPVTFIDPAADPYICGHRGHAGTSCGIKFSHFFELDAISGSDGCTLEECSRKGNCG